MNVFIVGAGFTKAIFPNAPLNGELLDTLSRKSCKSAARTLRERYETSDIEIALTRLDADIALTQKEEDKNLRKRIERELAEFFSQFVVSEDIMNENQWLSKLIDQSFSKGDVAISLNYDCVLEGALDCRDKWSTNGGYGLIFDNALISEDPPPPSDVTVLKIHGSSSFKIAPYVDKPSASSVNMVVKEDFFPRSGKNRNIEFGGEEGESYLIAPSYVKTPTVEVCYLMLDALLATARAERLIVVGTSLRPEDGFLTLLITNFLRQQSSSKKKIIIVNPEAQSIEKRLRNFWGVNIPCNVLYSLEKSVEKSVEQLLTALRD